MATRGVDPDYFDLTYFEFTGQEGLQWLATIGESL
jgi:hypothetical protein